MSGAGDSLIRNQSGTETAFTGAKDTDLTPGDKFKFFVGIVYDDERLATQTQTFVVDVSGLSYSPILSSSLYGSSTHLSMIYNNARIPYVNGSYPRIFTWFKPINSGYFNGAPLTPNDILLVITDNYGATFHTIDQGITMLKLSGTLLEG